MPKAIVMAVGDTPLNPLNDLLKQNAIVTKVTDIKGKSIDEVTGIVKISEQNHCLLFKGVKSLNETMGPICNSADISILLYCSPVAALSNVINNTKGNAKPEKVIERWQLAISDAVDFVSEYPSVFLCDLNDILNNTEKFLSAFFGMQEASVIDNSLSKSATSQLSEHMANLLLFEQDEAFTLYDEALSIGKLFGDFTVHLGPEADEIKQFATRSGKTIFNQLVTQRQKIESKKRELEKLSVETAEKEGELEKQVVGLREAKAAIEQKCAELQEELTNSKTFADQRNNKIQALENKLKKNEENLDSTRANKKALEVKLATLDEEIKAKEQTLSATLKQKIELEDKLQSSNQKQDEIQRQAEEQNATLRTLKEQVDSYKKSINEKDQIIAAKNAAVSDRDNKLRLANQQNSNLQKQHDALTETIGQLNQQQRDLEKALKEKDEALIANKALLKEVQDKLQSANQQNDDLQKQREDLKETIDQLNQQQRELEKVLVEKAQILASEQAILKDTQNELQTASLQLSELNKQKVQAEKKRQLDSDKIHELCKELEQQTKLLKTKTEEIGVLNHNLQAAQTLISSLESEKAAVSEECELSAIQIAQLQEELEISSSKLKNFKSVAHEFALQSKELKSVIQREEAVGNEKRLMELQFTLLQRELETLHSDYTGLKIIAEKYEQQSHILEAKTEQVNELTSEKTIVELQVAHLQEELENMVSQSDSLKSIASQYEQSRADLTAAIQQIEKAHHDKQLVDLQVGRLQEELEVVTAQRIEFTKAEELIRNEALAKAQKIEKLTTAKEELIVQCDSLKKQVKAAIAGQSQIEQGLISDLQVQLEQQLQQTQALRSDNAELKNQLGDIEVGMIDSKQFQQAELELASLQITQLQEELEYYYTAWQETQKQGISVTNMANNHQKIFNKAHAPLISVTGKYIEDGYQDLHILLSNVQLGDGRNFKELPVKLVKTGEHIAIEFRDSDDGALFNHYNDSTDEYGPYLRYYAEPSDNNATHQRLVYTRMIASERILVMSCIVLLAELIQKQDINSEVSLSNEEWRTWRLAAIKLAEAIEQLPNWLSFDSVILKEEYRAEGYEHLWLDLHNVLVGDSWKERMELKIAASGVKDSKRFEFCEDLSLEFRELEDGTPPLLTWPPESTDDFGPKFVISINQLNDIADLASLDRILISHLVNNLTSIIEKVEEKDVSMSRSKADWKLAVENLMKSNSAPLQSEAEDREPTLSIEEVISMDGYQHVLFVDKSRETKIKLKAQNINPDTFDAELYVELRNGREDVIYHHTAFFGEDEYGPRVLLPAESLLGDIIPNRVEEFEWLVRTFKLLTLEIERSGDIDELVKRLWVNILARKRAIL